MKIAVIGAGAIGGLLGSRMSLSGQDVTFVVRRPTYSDAINRNGFKLITPDGEELIAHNVHATTDIGEPGAQDLVILDFKAMTCFNILKHRGFMGTYGFSSCNASLNCVPEGDAELLSNIPCLFHHADRKSAGWRELGDTSHSFVC